MSSFFPYYSHLISKRCLTFILKQRDTCYLSALIKWPRIPWLLGSYVTDSSSLRRMGACSEPLYPLLNHVDLCCIECDKRTMHLTHRPMPLNSLEWWNYVSLELYFLWDAWYLVLLLQYQSKGIYMVK